jgi:hypothetical protein
VYYQVVGLQVGSAIAYHAQEKLRWHHRKNDVAPLCKLLQCIYHSYALVVLKTISLAHSPYLLAHIAVAGIQAHLHIFGKQVGYSRPKATSTNNSRYFLFHILLLFPEMKVSNYMIYPHTFSF